MYYLQSRYYNPETGRFINADGYVQTGQGLLDKNMFAYCQNNPITCIDPNGHSPWSRILSLFDYRHIHNKVAREVARKITGHIMNCEIYVKGPKGKGRLDVYDVYRNEYYEVKSAGCAFNLKTKKQMEKYDVATVKQGHGFINLDKTLGPVKRGTLNMSGSFNYGAWRVNYYSVEDGLIAYECIWDEERYESAVRLTATGALFVGITLAAVATGGSASPCYGALALI